MTQAFVGIDLGTTNARTAFLDGKEARLIPNRRGNRFTPSMVAFGADGEVLVGESARNQSALNPEGTVSCVKRLMGNRRPRAWSRRVIVERLVFDRDPLVPTDVDSAGRAGIVR